MNAISNPLSRIIGRTTHTNYFPGLVQISDIIDPDLPDFYFVPGFLTENRKLKNGPNLIGDWGSDVDAGTWEVNAYIFDKAIRGNVYLVNWPSTPHFFRELFTVWGFLGLGQIFLPCTSILLSGMMACGKAISSWREVVIESENSARQLFEVIKDKNKPSFIVGHSLGGRICLLIALWSMLLDVSNVHCISLAPAVSYDDISHLIEELSFAKTTDGCPLYSHRKEVDVFFSQNDYVLKHLFRLAEGNNAIGYNPFKLLGVHPINIINFSSRSFCNKVGHSDYSENIFSALEESLLFWRCYECYS